MTSRTVLWALLALATAGCDDRENLYISAAGAGGTTSQTAGQGGSSGGPGAAGQGGGPGGAGGVSGTSGQSGAAGTGGSAGSLSLPAGVHALAGLDPDLPYDDLAPFGQMVGDAPMVGLGESIHTSGGFYAAKHRLIRYLIESKGFRAVAMETPRTLAEQKTAPYVDACQGTSKDAAAGFFSVFGDENSAALLEWLCQWNQQHPADKVVFYGFDVQQPWDDAPALLAFLQQAAPDQAAALHGPIMASCYGLTAEERAEYFASGGNVSVPDDRFQACMAAVGAVSTWFDAHADELTQATSADALAWARISLLGIDSFERQARLYASDINAAYEARDEAMAQVFEAQRTLHFPGRKTVLWAHNDHLRAHSDTDKNFLNFHCMGSFLRDLHGDDYQPFGLVAYDVRINWPGQNCGVAYKIKKTAIESKLHDLGPGDFLLDLATASDGADPFVKPGVMYPYEGGGNAVLAEQFRGLVYLASSPGMKSLFWPDCSP